MNLLSLASTVIGVGAGSGDTQRLSFVRGRSHPYWYGVFTNDQGCREGISFGCHNSATPSARSKRIFVRRGNGYVDVSSRETEAVRGERISNEAQKDVQVIQEILLYSLF